MGYSLVDSGHDQRPHLDVSVFGFSFKALLDSGASRTVVGRLGWSMLQAYGIKVSVPDTSLQITLADGGQVSTLGSVSLPIVVEGKSVLIDCLVVPGVPHALILGIDFWTKAGIIPDLRRREWSFSRLEQEPSVALMDHSELDARQSEALGRLVGKAFEAMPEGLGRTHLVEHKIRVKAGVEPVKQRYYPVSPTIQSRMDEELKICSTRV